MPFQPPALDDRRYEDLVAELVDRIPAHTPEWTHARPGDPGRTLIELFAWLGDALLYRANLIPERQRLVFLRLIGLTLEPARPARGIARVSLKDTEPRDPLRVRPLARITGPASFEARSEFTVVPVSTAAFVKRPAAEDEVATDVREALAQFHAGGGAIRPYVTAPLFTNVPPPGEGTDVVADTTDRCLWLALLAPKAPAGRTQEAFNVEVLSKLAPADTSQRPVLNVGFVPALPTTDPLEPAAQRAAVPHVWEMTANTSRRPVTVDQPWLPDYVALDRIVDTTQGLTRAGILRFRLPSSEILHAPTNNVADDPNAGVGDRPPRIDDDNVAARIVVWLRLRPLPLNAAAASRTNQLQAPGETSLAAATSSASASPAVAQVTHLRVVWCDVNAVEFEQLETRTNVVIGESDGTADQSFPLPATSVEPETLRLEIEEDQGWVAWTRVDDLAAIDRDPQVSREARAFELDPEAGTVRFGDGLRGRIPAAGMRVRVGRLRSGGGTIGNLPAGTLKNVTAFGLDRQAVGGRLEVSQPLPFTGGVDAESLRDAERRMPARFRHHDRAVTLDDYRTLAQATPGLAVGRVEVLPRFKPQQRLFDVPGIVTVLALPSRPLAPAPNPRSDRPFLEAIHAHLDVRRPLGTELYVIGCEYLPLALSVALFVADGAEPDTTLQAVKDALRQVLWPLAGGGFDRTGWPLGRALSNRELAVEVARVDGVSEVAGLNLFRMAPTSGDWVPVGNARNGREQNLALQPWQLPELLAVVAIVGDSAPTSVASTGNPFADPNAVGVPVVPALC